MKKKLVALSIITALSSTLSVAAEPVKNQASEETETIVVTASRTQQDKFDVLAAIDVFDRDAIDQIQPVSVADLLNKVAGINVLSNGTKASNSSVFVRGSNSDHVLILVNGVRVGSATTGVKSLSSVAMALVERVEIVRGPRAALWGSDAIGGVVQIFTRQFGQGEGQVGIKYGSQNTQEAYAALGFGNNQHAYTLSASAEKSDGYDVRLGDETDEDGYDNQSVAFNGTSEFSQLYSLEVNAQLEQGNSEFDTGWGGNETDFTKHHILLRNHLDLDAAYLQFSYANARDNEVTFGNGADESLFETRRDQVSALAQMPLNQAGELVVGADWYNEKINTSATNRYAEDKRDALAVYATGRYQLEQVKLEASVRHDDIDKTGSETTYQLGAGYDINENTLIALTHGTSFKAPTFNDLYHPWGGNPDLISETADNTELLGRYQNDVFSVELSVYSTNYDDLIEWAPIDASDPFSPWQPSNVASASIKGAEATVTADLLGADHRLTLTHLDAENDATGKQLMRRPYFTANYSLTFQADSWDATLELNHQGARFADNYHTVKQGSYTLVNLAANIELSPALTLVLKASNLTDKDYQPVQDYNGRPQNFSAAVNYSF